MWGHWEPILTVCSRWTCYAVRVVRGEPGDWDGAEGAYWRRLLSCEEGSAAEPGARRHYP